MLCEQCHEQPATVFHTQVTGGTSASQSLCAACAAPVLAQVPASRWTTYTPTEDSVRELLERPADCPAEVFITDPISISDLAAALHAHTVQVAAVLMEHDIFVLPEATLDFASASLVCQRYGATPHPVA